VHEGEREVSSFDQGDEFNDRFLNAPPVERRVAVKLCVRFELLLVENLKREVRPDEQVNVEVNERECAFGEE
jgi:hypothetical protein